MFFGTEWKRGEERHQPFRAMPLDSSIGPPPRTVCAAPHAVGALGAFRSARCHGRPRRTGRPARCDGGSRAPLPALAVPAMVPANSGASPGSVARVSPKTVPDQFAHPGWLSMRPGGPARSGSPPSCWRPQTRHGTARRSETAISIRHDGCGPRRKTEPSGLLLDDCLDTGIGSGFADQPRKPSAGDKYGGNWDPRKQPVHGTSASRRQPIQPPGSAVAVCCCAHRAASYRTRIGRPG